MKRAEIAGTGVFTTALGFGGSTLGNLYEPVDDETALAAVTAAWDGGIRYFDTAPHYGLGLSERRLGRGLRDRPREQYTLSTKVGRLLVPNPSPTGSDLAAGGFAVPDDLTRVRSYSRDGVLRSLESSLERLGLDRVDVVYVHDPEDYMDAAITEAVPALVELREQGVVGAIGAGMNHVEPLRRFVKESDVDLVMVAGRWTLVDQRAEPLLNECSEAHVGVVVAAPFNSGLLACSSPAANATFDYDAAPANVLDVARACAAACERHGAELPAAALQFPLRHPAVVSVVSGMRTGAQVESNLAWMAAEIDARLWAELPAPARRAER
jgi:D-threo-aldose 1-dehydrogenase